MSVSPINPVCSCHALDVFLALSHRDLQLKGAQMAEGWEEEEYVYLLFGAHEASVLIWKKGRAGARDELVLPVHPDPAPASPVPATISK